MNWQHGRDAAFFHATNVMLHAWASTALFNVLAALLPAGEIATARGAALLFAVHPVHTEAVANLTARADVLATLLVLCAIACYLAAARARRAAAQGLALVSAAACFAAACLSKENGLTLLPFLVGLEVFRPDTVHGRSTWGATDDETSRSCV